MVAIINSSIVNSAILDSAAILKWDTYFSSANSLTLAKIGPFTLTLTQTNSIWLKLIHSHWTWWWQPSWILPCSDSDTAILDSDTLLTSLRHTQKYSPSTLTLTQTNSFWLKLTWWWQPSWILPSWFQPSAHHLDSDLTCMMAIRIPPSWIQPS